MNMTQQQEPLIFRQVAFSLSSFDYLKDYQREYERLHGKHLTNNQVLGIIIAEHREAKAQKGSRDE